MKRCKKCNIEKPLLDFRYRKDREIHYSQCKECEKKYKQENYLKNIEINKEYRKNYYVNNREKILTKVSEYQKNNKTWMKKYNSDPLFRLNHNIRCRINDFLTSKKTRKKNKTSEILGCNQEILKTFLEKKFKPNMTWDNYGDWHVDHIIPLSSGTNENEILKLCHFTNLQPLWKDENLKKRNKIL